VAAAAPAVLDRITHGVDFRHHPIETALNWVVTWAQEKGYPFELREIALAHRVGDATAQAYNRGDQKHLRLELMQVLEPIQEAKWHNSSLEHRAQIVYRWPLLHQTSCAHVSVAPTNSFCEHSCHTEPRRKS